MGTVRFWFIPFPFLVPEPFGSGSSNASTSPFCTDLTYPGEIPVFLACPDVDPMHSPKIGYSLCSQ